MQLVVPAASPRARFDFRIFFALATIYVLWGATYLAMRIAVTAMPPWQMAGSRFLVAGLTALAVARLRSEELPSKREWLVAIPAGALLFVVGNGLVAVAEQSLPSSVAAVFGATTPLLAAAIGSLRGERASRGEVVGMVLGMTGVIALARGADLFSAGPRGLLLVIAPIAFTFGSLLVRAHGPRRGGLAIAAPQMVAGGAINLVVSLASGEHFPTALPWSAVAAWLYLVVFGSLVGFTTYAWLLRNAPPALSMSFAYVNPLVAVVLGAAFGGEHLGAAALFASMLIAGGVMIAVATKGRPRPTT